MQHIIFILERKNITLIYIDIIKISIYNIGNIKNMLIIINQTPLTTSHKNCKIRHALVKIIFLLFYFLFVETSASYSQKQVLSPNYSFIKSEVEYSDSLKKGNYYLINIVSIKKESKRFSNHFKIVKRLKNDSYIVFYESIGLNLTEFKPNSFSLYEVENDWKKSINITKNHNDYLAGDYWLRISNFKEWEKFESSESGINTIRLSKSFVKVKLDNIQLKLLLNKGFITYIEKASRSPIGEARVLDLNLNPNRINTIHAYYPELDGETEVVSIKEPFYNINDIDISGRYIKSERESEFSDSHALEMATIIAGNGNSFLTGLGVAPEVFHSSSSNEEVLPDPIDYFNSNNIQTQNHSYGTEIESFYGVSASLYDHHLFENPQIIHVFSIGNSGFDASDHGRYEGLTGFSNITGNFKQAKNILTIGAVDTSMNTIELNSNGPAFDGRIKPELVAYSMTGTSNSAALVSGVSVLLQQAY